MRHRRPTIFDLQRLTGFSTTTISRAFNEYTDINPATRALILSKAKEIGYAPHPGARAIIEGRTRRWGLLLPHLENPRYAEIMSSLAGEARQRSTQLLLGLSHRDAEVEAELARHWAAGEADGIITDACVDVAVFDELYERRFPIVFLFARPSEKFDVITLNVMGCCVELMERLIAHGHRRIAYISQAHPGIRGAKSFVAYEQVLAAHGRSLDEPLLFFGKSDHTAGWEAWRHWRGHPDRPTACFCFNDIIACDLIQAAREDGLRIPRDLSVVGMDDIRMASFFNLTTVRINPADIAKEALALLERTDEHPGEKHPVSGEIAERGSVGPAPAR